MGDLKGAEDALRQAHSLGRIPQPALALIRLSEGKIAAAHGAIRSALAEAGDRWARARMLPAQVEIAIAAGDLATARASAAELGEISAAFASPALRARMHDGSGRVLLAEDDAEGATRELHDGIGRWQDVGAPYEIARDRVLLARALYELERDDEADLELQAAREEFRRMGAVREEAAVADILRAAAPGRADHHLQDLHVHRHRRLDEPRRGHGRRSLGAPPAVARWHVAGLFVDHGGEVVNSTGDGFFVAFDSASSGNRVCYGGPAGAREHRRTTVRSRRAHRCPFGGGHPQGRGLQRKGGPRRREDRDARTRRGDRGLGSDRLTRRITCVR